MKKYQPSPEDIARTNGATLRRLCTKAVLREVLLERQAQDEIWGEQNHPDGTDKVNEVAANVTKAWNKVFAEAGDVDWKHVLDEEVLEAFAEEDPVKLRAELVQVAAVAVAWVESIDRRDGGAV